MSKKNSHPTSDSQLQTKRFSNVKCYCLLSHMLKIGSFDILHACSKRFDYIRLLQAHFNQMSQQDGLIVMILNSNILIKYQIYHFQIKPAKIQS